MGRTLPVPVLCQVCGDKSYGRHYGVFCCDGCSCFFKRSIRKSIVYTCISGDHNCIIDKTRRNWCPACRLDKCFAVHMNKSAVQEERGPRKGRKIKNDTEDSTSRRAIKAKYCSSAIENTIMQTTVDETKIIESKCDGWLVEVIETSIRLALQTPLLQFCDNDRKLAIISKIWPNFFAIFLSCKLHDDPSLLTNLQQDRSGRFTWPEIEAFLDIVKLTKNCNLDAHELYVAICIMICCTDEVGSVSSLFDLYRLMLVHHNKVFYPNDSLRSTQIFYYLCAIKNIDFNRLLAAIFGAGWSKKGEGVLRFIESCIIGNN